MIAGTGGDCLLAGLAAIVGRSAGAPAGAVHLDAVARDLVDVAVDRGVGREQRAEIGVVEDQELAIAERGNVGSARASAEQRELAEEIAAAELDLLALDVTSTAPEEMKYIASPRSPRRISRSPGTAKRGSSRAVTLSS